VESPHAEGCSALHYKLQLGQRAVSFSHSLESLTCAVMQEGNDLHEAGGNANLKKLAA